MANILGNFIDSLINIIDLKITSVGVFITTGALVLALKEYKNREIAKRNNLKQIKKATLDGILKELEFLGNWFRTPYPENFEAKGWGPYDMVFKTEGAEYTKLAIDPKYTFLYGNEFLNVLVIFNQLNTNFKQLVERDLLYSNSSPNLANKAHILLDGLKGENKAKFINDIKRKSNCKEVLTNEELFILVKQKLMRAVHTSGIGDKNNPQSLHSSFCRLEELTKKELESLEIDNQFNPPQSFKWFGYINVFLFVMMFLIFVSISKEFK